MSAVDGEVTRLLHVLRGGNREVESSLMELLYSEFRRLAAARLRSERSDHTLTPTALVHEAYLRFAGEEGHAQDRAHFLAIAATAMRRVLVDHARGRLTQKRGGAPDRVDLDCRDLAIPGSDEDLLALNEALSRLGEISPRQSRVVEMRYFAGLTEEEIATSLGVNLRTVNRDWQMARAWLHQQLKR